MSETIPSDTDPAARLASYIDVWAAAIADFLAFAESLPEGAWMASTELPGWTAHDVLAHLVHLESITVGEPHPEVEIGDVGHVRNSMGTFCEEGVVALRDVPATTLVQRLRDVTTQRLHDLRATPPTDPEGTAPYAFGAIGWNNDTFFGNRPLDVWMHDLDVRRAVGQPGGLDGIPAAYTARKLLGSVPFVIGKRVAPPAGTSVVLTVGALPPVAALVGEDGRARNVAAEEIADPTVRITTDLEAFVLASGGRGTPDDARWATEGDAELARSVIASLAVTP